MTQPEMGFRADLDELALVATWRLPQVALMFDFQADRLTGYEGVNAPDGWSGLLNNSFHHFIGALRDRARDGAEAVRATGEALQDVVALYRRADGQE
ncbi:hypothetical protein [Actinokineospora sp. NPDC004072]